MNSNSVVIHVILWFKLLALVGFLAACGGDSSGVAGSDSLPSPVPDSFEEGEPVAGPGGRPPASAEELALLPQVSAGTRQFADPNVLILLQGSVQAAEGADIVRTLWIQIAGPTVEFSEPEGLRNLVMAPAVESTTQLEFRLIAEDSEGRINSASVAVVVRPVEGQIPEQRIRFSNPGPVDVIVGDTYSNALDPEIVPVGSGALTYQSSNSSVASVDAEGVVTTLSLGSTRITVTKEADEQYRAATDSYEVFVVPPDAVAFNALIGNESSTVLFPTDPVDHFFIRSSDISCDPTGYFACENGQGDAVEGDAIEDSVLTLNAVGYYWLERRGYLSSPFSVIGNTDGVRSDAPPARFDHVLVPFNDHLWLIGGELVFQDETGASYEDVWSSADGISWEPVTESLLVQDGSDRFAPISKVVTYNEALWALDDNTGELYRSEDGANWTQQETLPIDPRQQHQLIVFQEQLLLIGVYFGGTSAGELETWLYDQTEGWLKQEGVTQFSSIYSVEIIAFNNRLWMIGEIFGDIINPSGIWSSANGIDWVPETNADASFENNYGFKLAVFNEQLWLVGGYSPDMGLTNQVWSTTDGRAWTEVSTNAGFEPRGSFGLTTFDGKLWLNGGLNFGANTPTYQDTWVTEDGIEWRRVYRGLISFTDSSLEF